MNSTNPMQHNCLIKKECTGIPHETYSKLVHTYQNHIEGHMKMKAMLLTVEESRTPWVRNTLILIILHKVLSLWKKFSVAHCPQSIMKVSFHHRN